MSIGGTHVQAGTGRRLRYWVTFEGVDGQAVYAATVYEADRHLASLDGGFAYDARSLATEDAVRLHLKQQIDRSHFGEGKGPDPEWLKSWVHSGPYR